MDLPMERLIIEPSRYKNIERQGCSNAEDRAFWHREIGHRCCFCFGRGEWLCCTHGLMFEAPGESLLRGGMRWDEKRMKRRQKRTERVEKAKAALRACQLRRFTNRFVLLLSVVTFICGVGAYCWMLCNSMHEITACMQQPQKKSTSAAEQKTGGGVTGKKNRTHEVEEGTNSSINRSNTNSSIESEVQHMTTVIAVTRTTIDYLPSSWSS